MAAVVAAAVAAVVAAAVAAVVAAAVAAAVAVAVALKCRPESFSFRKRRPNLSHSTLTIFVKTSTNDMSKKLTGW